MESSAFYRLSAVGPLHPIVDCCSAAARFGTRIARSNKRPITAVFLAQTKFGLVLGRATERMATPIGSPRVPSTVGSSLVTPVARDAVEPHESAHAARCASHASLARFANASLLASPAEDDESAPLHVPLLPCTAFATPGTINASMPAADARALPALPAFSASAASAAHPSASFPTDFCLVLCPFAGIQRAPGPCLGLGPTVVVLRFQTRYPPDLLCPAPGRNGPLPFHAEPGPLTSPHGPGAGLMQRAMVVMVLAFWPLPRVRCNAKCPGRPRNPEDRRVGHHRTP